MKFSWILCTWDGALIKYIFQLSKAFLYGYCNTLLSLLVLLTVDFPPRWEFQTTRNLISVLWFSLAYWIYFSTDSLLSMKLPLRWSLNKIVLSDLQVTDIWARSSSSIPQHLHVALTTGWLNLCLFDWCKYVPVNSLHLTIPLRTSSTVDSSDGQTLWTLSIFIESIFRFITVNFLIIRTPKTFVVFILKFEQRGFTVEKRVQKT